jgi:hypothetical protein
VLSAAPGKPWEARWDVGGSKQLKVRLLRLVETDEQGFVVKMLGTRVSSDPQFEGWRDMAGVLRSNSLSVIEGFTGDAVGLLNIAPVKAERVGDDAATAVRVQYPGGFDAIIVTSAPGLTMAAEYGVETNGRVTVVRFGRDGEKPAMLLRQAVPENVRFVAALWQTQSPESPSCLSVR